MDVLLVLDRALPDERIIADVREVLRENSESDAVAVELDGEWLSVPCDVPIEVVTKACFREKYGIGFGTYKAQIALGGVTDEADGFLEAKFCFATLYYTDNAQLITVYFHKDAR